MKRCYNLLQWRKTDFVQMVPSRDRKSNAVCPVLREVVHQLTRGEAIVDGHPMFLSVSYTNGSTTEPGILFTVLRRGLFAKVPNGVAKSKKLFKDAIVDILLLILVPGQFLGEARKCQNELLLLLLLLSAAIVGWKLFRLKEAFSLRLEDSNKLN